MSIQNLLNDIAISLLPICKAKIDAEFKSDFKLLNKIMNAYKPLSEMTEAELAAFDKHTAELI